MITRSPSLGKLPAPSLCEQPTRNDIISAFEAYNEEAWDIINRLTYDPLYFHEERLNVQFNSLWQAREEIAKRISFLTRLSKLTGKPVPSIQDLVNGPWLNLAYRLLMNQQ